MYPMKESRQRKVGIPSIEGSERYYRVPDTVMNLFSAAYPAYDFVVKQFVQQKNPTFSEPSPHQHCVLGGFYPDHSNIEATHKLAALAGLQPEHCLYLDINPQPASILSEAEQQRFHQVDLARLLDAKTDEGTPLIPEGSIKLLILDHVTEFMDDPQLDAFFKNLSLLLAPDGVALMQTVEVANRAEKLFQKLKRILVMKTRVYIRTRPEWRKAITAHLAASARFSFPLGNEDRELYVLSKTDSVYGNDLLKSNWIEEEFRTYAHKLEAAKKADAELE